MEGPEKGPGKFRGPGFGLLPFPPRGYSQFGWGGTQGKGEVLSFYQNHGFTKGRNLPFFENPDWGDLAGGQKGLGLGKIWRKGKVPV